MHEKLRKWQDLKDSEKNQLVGSFYKWLVDDKYRKNKYKQDGLLYILNFMKERGVEIKGSPLRQIYYMIRFRLSSNSSTAGDLNNIEYVLGLVQSYIEEMRDLWEILYKQLKNDIIANKMSSRDKVDLAKIILTALPTLYKDKIEITEQFFSTEENNSQEELEKVILSE